MTDKRDEMDKMENPEHVAGSDKMALTDRDRKQLGDWNLGRKALRALEAVAEKLRQVEAENLRLVQEAMDRSAEIEGCRNAMRSAELAFGDHWMIGARQVAEAGNAGWSMVVQQALDNLEEELSAAQHEEERLNAMLEHKSEEITKLQKQLFDAHCLLSDALAAVNPEEYPELSERLSTVLDDDQCPPQCQRLLEAQQEVERLQHLWDGGRAEYRVVWRLVEKLGLEPGGGCPDSRIVNHVSDLKAEVERLKARTCEHGWRGSAPEEGQRIRTPCPACGLTSLFIGTGGHLTCSGVPGRESQGCPSPGVAQTWDDLKQRLKDAEAAMLTLLRAVKNEGAPAWWSSSEADSARKRYIQDGPDRKLAALFLAVEGAEAALRGEAKGE